MGDALWLLFRAPASPSLGHLSGRYLLSLFSQLFRTLSCQFSNLAVFASCLELALEGERLCKAGDFKAGVAFFEAAVQVGTEDLRTLSAIYSQLGNAYFYLKEYARALEYHRHDLLLARGHSSAASVAGPPAPAPARAVLAGAGHGSDRLAPRRNLSLVKELGDRAAQGRAYGNLGNTHYLLGSFVEATTFHKERLAIAKEFGDKAAERRAYSNLGNAHIFLGRFDVAAEYYKPCRPLGGEQATPGTLVAECPAPPLRSSWAAHPWTPTLDLPTSCQAGPDHLDAGAWEAWGRGVQVWTVSLPGRVGEGRACWSLGNAYVSMGSPAQALTFAKKHLEISQEVSQAGPAPAPALPRPRGKPPGTQPTPVRPGALCAPGS
ncbi:PREDICTED: G-protein-signaling modulator 1 [Myotis davidii]|uniref:G-protein-signaling modulator 1 n=1 Tax=Myotis davidii TaxID=225400 RepID=UPI000767917B|nr:PREDICTED: G-protein-signaling modulator 1 [Myotis davidii]